MQELFVAEYIKDWSGKKAAIRAGYAEKWACREACKTLHKPHIKARIREVLDASYINSTRILGELAKVAYADMGDYGTVTHGGGFEPFPFEDLEPGATRAVKGVKERRRITEGKYGEVIIDQQYAYDLHDKTKALELLLKYDEKFPGFVMGKEDQKEAANISEESSVVDLLKDIRSRIGKV